MVTLLLGALPAAQAYVDDVELQCEARYVRTTLDARCTGKRAQARDCACRATYRVLAVVAAPVKWPFDAGHTLVLEYRCDRNGLPSAAGERRPWAKPQGDGKLFVHVPLSDVVQVGARRWEIDNANGRYAPQASAGTPRTPKESQ